MIWLLLALQDVDKADVARAHVEQLASSLKLYAEFNGAYPAKLDDLLKKPDAVKLWPDGGYLLVDALPKDPWGRDYAYDGKSIASKGPDEKAVEDDVSQTLPIVAMSTIKDAAALTRFVRLDLARTSVIAVRRRTKALVTSMKELIESPYGLTKNVGAKLSAGGITLKGSKDCVRVTFSTHPLEVKPLTDDERKQLEKAVADLASDDVDTRDKATEALRAMGSKILDTLDAVRSGDPEVRARIDQLVRDIRKPIDEALKVGASHVYVFPNAGIPLPATIASNERNAATCLKATVTAEENMKGNDIDRNGIGDYWTGDLRGLYCIVMTATMKPTASLSDVNMALADTSPVVEKYEGIDMDADGTPDTKYDTSIIKGFGEFPVPKNGYLFKALIFDPDGNAYAQDTDGTGATHNYGQYGFCAYPAEFGATGTHTFIVNNIGSVFKADLRGRPVDAWPDDAQLKKEWKKVE